jgi:hypothetical protein
VAVTTLLAPLGDAAPYAWVSLVRLASAVGVGLAFLIGRRLGGSAAGWLAAAAVALTGGFVRHAAVGDSEPLLIALALAAVLLALDERHRAALALGVGCALLRPETWPFLALYGLWRWREDAALRPALAGLAVAVPAAWLVPEWIGSGELLRSSDRARIPNPGQPATAERPALEALEDGAAILFLPLVLAAVAARGPARLLAAAGAAWIVLVALMSEAGFSGEARYALPGAALLAVAAGPGAARLAASRDGFVARAGLAALAVGAIASMAAAGVRLADVADLRPRLQHQAKLDEGLDRAIKLAGGRSAVLRCGRPAVGRYRGTLLAWHLDVAKRRVRADGRPAAVTFRSRLVAGGRVSPSRPRGGRVAAIADGWQVVTVCRR